MLCRERRLSTPFAQTIDGGKLGHSLGQFGLGGRLADNIRERQGMAYYAFSDFNANFGESPLVVRAGDASTALAAVRQGLKQVAPNVPMAAA